MTALTQDTVVGVLGAGAMGTGIAQVALVRGHRVVLADARPDAAERAGEQLAKALAREVEKGRLTPAAANGAHRRLTVVRGVEDLSQFAECGLVIEAVIEDLSVKRESFRRLEEVVAADAVLATNTSSLSVASIAGGCRRPERVVGVHFFNPAPVLPLVEIVPALTTEAALADDVRALVDGWGKTTVRAADTPGFIVNRVARPFYGEALRIHDEGLADAATIDWALRDLGGFRMGPFELMDFIGLDVNFAVTRSVYEQTFHDPRYRPSLTQQRLVEAGRLGKKTRRGFYDYAEGAVKPEPRRDAALGNEIVRRVLAMLVNEACDAVHWRVATAADVELSMTKGVNYPRGLLAWGDLLGASTVLDEMERLHATYAEDRYRPSVYLRAAATANRSLLA